MVRYHGLATLPVAKSVSIALGVASTHGDECDKEKTEQKDDFERGHDELGFTVERSWSRISNQVGMMLGWCFTF